MQQLQYMEKKLRIKLQKLTLKTTPILFYIEYRLKLNGKFLILCKPLENEKRKFHCMSFGKVCHHKGKMMFRNIKIQLFRKGSFNERIVVSENCLCRLCKIFNQHVL